MPERLRIERLDGLEEKLTSVIVVLPGVTLLGSAVSGPSGRGILCYGLVIAAALTLLIVLQLLGGQAKATGRGGSGKYQER